MSRREDSGVHLTVRGKVSLVGAGPGDPDLLTLKAYRLIREADVVAYDELVSPQILALAPPHAERIAVGRRKGTHPDAPSIHETVLARALAGIDVVRLKGGDPLVFGRGGEEAEVLARLGVAVEIVPGVSAALGAASSTGIPLTHRDVASSVTFVTAQTKLGTDHALARRIPREGTVVLYMGLGKLAELAAELVRDGRDASTPVAVVSQATLPDERCIVATLGTIAARLAEDPLPAPAITIVGDVVAHRTIPEIAAIGARAASG